MLQYSAYALTIMYYFSYCTSMFNQVCNVNINVCVYCICRMDLGRRYYVQRVINCNLGSRKGQIYTRSGICFFGSTDFRLIFALSVLCSLLSMTFLSLNVASHLFSAFLFFLLLPFNNVCKKEEEVSR